MKASAIDDMKVIKIILTLTRTNILNQDCREGKVEGLLPIITHTKWDSVILYVIQKVWYWFGALCYVVTCTKDAVRERYSWRYQLIIICTYNVGLGMVLI